MALAQAAEFIGRRLQEQSNCTLKEFQDADQSVPEVFRVACESILNEERCLQWNTCEWVGMDGESEEEVEATFIVATLIALIFVLFISYAYETWHICHRLERFFPHCCAQVIYGIVMGAVLKGIGLHDEAFDFRPDFFFLILLPPIIFCAGFSLRKDFFFHNLGTIIIFAFIGTGISSFFIGTVLYYVGQWSDIYPLNWVDSMIFGSLISAVDPIATIAVMQSLGVNKQLYIMVFGESVLNDAAAVVICRVFIEIAIRSGDSDSAGELAMAVPNILKVAVCSIAIGLSFAFLGSLLHKHSKVRTHPKLEVMIFFIEAYIPYVVAEKLGLSGIMAIIFNGIVADHYTYFHLSEVGRNGLKLFVESLAELLESFIFVCLGMAIFTVDTYRWPFIMVSMALCIIGRALSIFPLAVCVNKFRKHKIPYAHMVVMWFSGLRGPVAFALAMSVPYTKENPLEYEVKEIMITTSLIVIFMTTFVIGGLTLPILRCAGVIVDQSDAGSPELVYDMTNHWFHRLDKRFLRSWFGSHNERNVWDRERYENIKMDKFLPSDTKNHHQRARDGNADDVELVSFRNNMRAAIEREDSDSGKASAYDFDEIDFDERDIGGIEEVGITTGNDTAQETLHSDLHSDSSEKLLFEEAQFAEPARDA